MQNIKTNKCFKFEEKNQSEPCQKQCVECGVADLQVTYEQVSEVSFNKVNVYTCSCGKNTVVKHRDKGVTPMFIDCIHCGERAISHMYKVPQDLKHHLVAYVPKDKAEWKLYKKYLQEFYKKENLTPADYNNMMQATKQHCKQGGAIMIPAEKMEIN